MPRPRPTRCTGTRGEKGIPHRDPEDPPRRRANKRRGHGTFANDRPPVVGVTGRESGQVRPEVVGNSDRETLEDAVGRTTPEGATVYTDEWKGYARLPEIHRGHATVSHAEKEWARDDDGDGVREVHDNTLEGIWTGLRNYLRNFRGVSKHYLWQYVAMFQWSYNIKTVTDDFLRTLLGISPFTNLAP